MLGLAAPLARQRHVHAVIVEDALKLNDVGEMRDILEHERVLGQKARDHQRKRGILRAGDRDAAVERLAAIDAYAIHCCPRARSAKSAFDPPRRAIGAKIGWCQRLPLSGPDSSGRAASALPDA